MVAQVGLSPAALPSLNSTWPGRASSMASLKPWVAASSATWGASWQMPTTYFSPAARALSAGWEAEGAGALALGEGLAEPPPQAARETDRAAARARAAIFDSFFISFILPVVQVNYFSAFRC